MATWKGSRQLCGDSVATAVAPAAGPAFEVGMLGMQRAATQRTIGNDAEALASLTKFLEGRRRLQLLP